MKKNTYQMIFRFGIIGLLFLAVSCKKVDKLTHFNMKYSEEITIPSNTGLNLPFNLYTPDVESDSKTQFELNDTRKDLVEQIVLKELQLTVTDPQNRDFSFLKSINIFISAEGLDEKKIAWLEDIPADAGNTLNLTTSDEDFQEYIKKDVFELRLNTVTDELLTTDYTIQVDATFFVDAKILGV